MAPSPKSTSKAGAAEGTNELRARCEQLARDLARVQAERDEALRDVARAREALDALRLTVVGIGHQPGEEFGLGGEQVPLRYVVVDAVNLRLKKLLGPAHGSLKVNARRVVKRLKG